MEKVIDLDRGVNIGRDRDPRLDGASDGFVVAHQFPISRHTFLLAESIYVPFYRLACRRRNPPTTNPTIVGTQAARKEDNNPASPNERVKNDAV
jgi:hypothetical protein